MNPGSHHPERSGTVRTYAPAGHRHAAEVEQAVMGPHGRFGLHVTIAAVELVRGVLCTAHVIPTRPVDEKELSPPPTASASSAPSPTATPP